MPTKDKMMILEACVYEDLPKYTKVFNEDTAEYHLWIYLNPAYVRNTYLYEAKEIGPNADNSKLFLDTFKRESQCWIKVKREYLNNKIGKHIYKLSFVNKETDADFSLYVSYYLQNDNPEKPYVYIEKAAEEPYKDGSNPPLTPPIIYS
mgnify:CR=1 FL=1